MLRAILSKKTWISFRLSLLWQNWLLLKSCWLLPQVKNGIWFNLMWTMPFLMAIYLKKFIWIFLLVMVNMVRDWFVSFINRSMVSSKPQDNGTPNFLTSFFNIALSNLSLIILCLPKDLDLHLLLCWSM